MISTKGASLDQGINRNNLIGALDSDYSSIGRGGADVGGDPVSTNDFANRQEDDLEDIQVGIKVYNNKGSRYRVQTKSGAPQTPMTEKKFAS